MLSYSLWVLDFAYFWYYNYDNTVLEINSPEMPSGKVLLAYLNICRNILLSVSL